MVRDVRYHVSDLPLCFKLVDSGFPILVVSVTIKVMGKVLSLKLARNSGGNPEGYLKIQD